MKREDIREEVFWSFVDILGPDDCWNWLRCCDKGGYGQFWVGSGPELSHRVGWILQNGLIPELFQSLPAQICHSCDNPSCCNPNHLFLGNAVVNQKDSAIKGRHSYSQFQQRGGNNSFAKLLEAQVKEIKRFLREGRLTQDEIGKLYGVSQLAVSCIYTGKTWAHVKL